MNSLATKSGFDLAPKDMGQAMQLAQMICNSQLAPQNYKGKPEDTLVAMMMGHELGLNPMQSIQNIAVINGKPSIYGDAMLALVQNHPAFGGINEAFDESTWTATCTVWRKNGERHTQTFSRRDAEAAKLWGKKGPWTDYPKRMLTMRARGFALRNQFADALCGLISAEEAQDLPKEEKVIQMAATQAPQLDAYLTEAQAQELEDMAAPRPALIGKIKQAYQISTLTQLPAGKFDECKQRIAKFMEASHANS